MGLVDPGNLGVQNVQGDLAKKLLDCPVLLSVPSPLGSLVFRVDHHHRWLGVLVVLEVQ